MEKRRGRPKGTPKTGGRAKGTPNKRTQLGGEDALRRLAEVMEEPERMMEELKELHGKDYFRTYFDAQAYLRPKLSSVEFQGDVNVANEVAERLRESVER